MNACLSRTTRTSSSIFVVPKSLEALPCDRLSGALNGTLGEGQRAVHRETCFRFRGAPLLEASLRPSAMPAATARAMTSLISPAGPISKPNSLFRRRPGPRFDKVRRVRSIVDHTRRRTASRRCVPRSGRPSLAYGGPTRPGRSSSCCSRRWARSLSIYSDRSRLTTSAPPHTHKRSHFR
jgi:hypothetical protein